MLYKYLFSILISYILVVSCNDNSKDLLRKGEDNYKYIDSIRKEPVLLFFNTYQRKKFNLPEDDKGISIDSIENQLEKMQIKNDIYYAYQSYCLYLRGKMLDAGESANKSLQLNDSNYLADCMKIYYQIGFLSYDIDSLNVNYKLVKNKYKSEDLKDFEMCYKNLLSLMENLDKYLPQNKSK